ncbi:MmcQ/YjbR family DNA-binding protein [Myxococcota bacterium]|nr:MmcQ/YjbR family DNA-binding protein [Myxococcota bacterium]
MKTPSTKTSSTKKPPSKKSPSKKSPTEKSPSKKSPSKKSPSKKSPSKKSPTKKSPTKSSPAKAPRAGAAPFADAHARLVALAMRYPEATKDFPWGELVVKVKKKVFVFFGRPDDGDFGLSVKLPQSGAAALMAPFAAPTGYGLGKSGWVTLTFADARTLPMELLERWIDESYRAVAPKTLVARLG